MRADCQLPRLLCRKSLCAAATSAAQLCPIHPSALRSKITGDCRRCNLKEKGKPMSAAIDLHPERLSPKSIAWKFGPAISKVKRVSLALQGGSAHGAFTWGVLDRLLEEPRIEVEGVSATSAGAMNAAVMAHGLTTGGRKGAREALEEFWHGVARISAPFGALQLFEIVSRFLSPYQLNPFNYNPLRQLIRQVINFERLRQGSAIKLFLPATNVRTGKIKVFTDKELPQSVCLRRPVYRSSIKPSRLTASTTGTAAIWETRRYSR